MPFAIEPFADVLGVAEPHASGRRASRAPGLAAPTTETDRRASVAGRVVLPARQGKLVVRDAPRSAPATCSSSASRRRSATAYALLDEIDLGDIVGATGHVVRDEARRAVAEGGRAHDADEGAAPAAGEVARPEGPRPPAATALPAPDHRHDRRAAYVSARAAVLRDDPRACSTSEGFVEVETPVLQPIAGRGDGAARSPRTTTRSTSDLKLRISLELYLKRMLVGGVERIYEIGRNFRNEGIDRDHNPEFTMLEAYQAYGDYHTMMELSEDAGPEPRARGPLLGARPSPYPVPRAASST